MSESGEVIVKNKMIEPRFFSVSNEIIYLTDKKAGVYQSTDDGVSWSLVFKSTDEWYCREVIKVTTDCCDDYWALEKNDNNSYHLRVYSVDKRRSHNVTWRDIDVTTTDGKHINLSHSKLSYDGDKNIFLSECYNKAVHVLSVNSPNHCQPLLSQYVKTKPRKLAVDKERQQLYVGQTGGEVEVFQYAYADGAD